MGNRDEGFTYKPRTVAPIIRGQDDWRSTYYRNKAIQNANTVRERRATVENPDWLLAQSPETWKNEEFLSKANPVLSKLKANQDFWTTDKDEPRNMYQMAINNMYGGKGARMLDLSGLPSIVQSNPNKYRRGRTLFQDPSKSAGFLNDFKVMLGDMSLQDKRLSEEERTSNPAAVRATEYNPFHEEGYGKDFYIDEFGEPWGEKLAGLMKLALPGPLKFMKGKEKEPLLSDRSWIPENVGAYNEIDEIPFMGDINDIIPQEGIAPLVPEHIQKSTLWGINQDKNEGKGIFYGGSGELSPDFDYEEDREGRELSAKISFLESVHPGIDYDNVNPALIDEMYEKALVEGEWETEIEEEIIPEIIPQEEDKFKHLPLHSIRSMIGQN